MNIGTFNTKKQGEMVHFAVLPLTRDIDTHRVGNKREKGGKGKRGVGNVFHNEVMIRIHVVVMTKVLRRLSTYLTHTPLSRPGIGLAGSTKWWCCT